jgi:hypothetical protein
MPELTAQDRESYQKLRGAAIKLKEAILNGVEPQIGASPTLTELTTLKKLTALKELTEAFSAQLPEPEKLSSFEQLQSQVELTGGYLTMYQLFAAAIKTDDTALAAINEASQRLLMQYTQLKLSLEAVDEDFLDDVTTTCSDPLFIGLLTDFTVKTWTNQILSDQAPVLTDSQVQELINAWGTAVTAFVEDARKDANDSDPVKPGQSTTIAHFFCIHDQLEGLYSELSTSVALNS